MQGFSGFGEHALEFWEGLTADNSKTYWQAHKDTFTREIAEPLEALADALTPEFGEVRRFRPYRDVRFSKDKSPYQLFASMAATGARDSGMLYLQLGLDGLLLAGGYYQPATDTLNRFRTAVSDPAVAASFDSTRDALAAEGLVLDGDPLKTAPRGWDRDHPRLDLLRLRNLALSRTRPVGPWLQTPECQEVVATTWRSIETWNDWLHRHVGAPS